MRLHSLLLVCFPKLPYADCALIIVLSNGVDGNTCSVRGQYDCTYTCLICVAVVDHVHVYNYTYIMTHRRIHIHTVVCSVCTHDTILLTLTN